MYINLILYMYINLILYMYIHDLVVTCSVCLFVGCREAGCTPFATSLISDYFDEVLYLLLVTNVLYVHVCNVQFYKTLLHYIVKLHLLNIKSKETIPALLVSTVKVQHWFRLVSTLFQTTEQY